jgi:hypothetical protein
MGWSLGVTLEHFASSAQATALEKPKADRPMERRELEWVA